MKPRLATLVLLSLALAAHTPPCAAGPLFHRAAKPASTYQAFVTAVDDGDTVWVKKVAAGKPVGAAFKLRLHWSDTDEIGHNSKESDQPDGQAAKVFTSKAVLNKTVTVKNRARSYDRVVADITEPDGTPLGLDLVKHGHAELDPRYKPPADWLKAQDDAKTAKLGRWAIEGEVPPWQWRKEGDAKK